MDERIEKLALDAGLLNYVDNETPRRYFVDGHADLEEVEKFAELIVQETIKEMASQMLHFGMDESNNPAFYKAVNKVKEHFGVE